MTIFEIVLWVSITYLILSSIKIIISKFTSSVRAVQTSVEDEDEEELLPSNVQRRTIHVDIRLEPIKGNWYGWLQSDGAEHFVAQGVTKQDAMVNCTRRMVKDDKIYVIKYIE